MRHQCKCPLGSQWRDLGWRWTSGGFTAQTRKFKPVEDMASFGKGPSIRKRTPACRGGRKKGAQQDAGIVAGGGRRPSRSHAAEEEENSLRTHCVPAFC